MQFDVLDRLVEFLVRDDGHPSGPAVLAGALGSGLGRGLTACAQRLADQGIAVLRHDLQGGAHAALPLPPSTGPGTVVVLDARGCTQAAVVGEALAEVRSRSSRALLVAPLAPAWDEVHAEARARGARTFVLRPWSEAQVAEHLRERGLAHLDPALVASLTGGLPWLLSHVTDDPDHDPLAAGPEAPGWARARDLVLERIAACEQDVADAALALAVGYPVDGHLGLPPAPREDREAQDRLLRSVDGAGLLGADGQLPGWVRACLRRHAPAHRLQRWRDQLVDDIFRAGEDPCAWSLDLVEQGVTDPQVLDALVTCAHRLAREHGDAMSREQAVCEARRQLLLAVRAGARGLGPHVELARLALLAGDVGAAARSIDDVLAMEPDASGVPADTVAVGLLVARAQDLPHRARDLLGWVAAHDPRGIDRATVALDLYAAGERERGDAVLAAATERADPTESSTLLLAHALQLSLEGDGSAGLPGMMLALEAAGGRAGADPMGGAESWVTLWGLHAGDLALVRSVVAQAQATGHLGPLARTHLRIRAAWADMLDPQLDAEPVRPLLDDLGPIAPRDRLWVSALRVGLARRADDAVALRTEWEAVREDVLRHPVSLHHLLPLGELALAAARLRDIDVLRTQLQQAGALLERLGEPPLWAAPFHWYGVQVALQQDAPRELAPHAAALGRAATAGGTPAVLSAAGRCWVRVRAGEVEAAAVEQMARDLADSGWAWEAARLLGHGAAASTDRRDSARLLEVAREVLPRPGTPAPRAAPVKSQHLAEQPVRPGGLRLSERERQVAELVVAGRTYKEVAEVLYLSPKTVEHHVARLRRRSGAGSRSELLRLLQSEVAPRGDRSSALHESVSGL